MAEVKNKVTTVESLAALHTYNKKAYVQNLPVTTAGSGSAYTATIDGITALTKGMIITIIPHTVSTTTAPTLNLNSLGAKTIRMPVAYNTSLTTGGGVSSWLAANCPITLQYNGTYWLTVGLQKPSAQNLYGTVPVANGGTGVTSIDDLKTALGVGEGAKIQTGSYVGTGTYGSSNPCSLTFDFVPYMIFIVGEGADFSMEAAGGTWAILARPQTIFGNTAARNVGYHPVYVTWNDNGVSYYATTSAKDGYDDENHPGSTQLNRLGEQYSYMAIGT